MAEGIDTRALFIGTSGFSYKHWTGGVFYPPGLPSHRWLSFYAERFNCIEMNVSFYRLPSKEAYRSWYEATPKDFVFLIKGSRFITHIKRLKDCRDPLRVFFERAEPLSQKLKAVLWQLPPRFKKDVLRLESFVGELALYQDVGHAFEFREESWLSADVAEVLSRRNIAVCRADSPKFSVSYPDTADFVYQRRHGHSEEGPEPACYSHGELRRDAAEIRRLVKRKRKVFICFNNDPKGYAISNALELKSLLVKETAPAGR